ncbi:hypothetical protein, partial [Prevotella melaninogenica]|uniref:hypothetical protein n=1 Tax=Prevotella melaninogenica TaxID=28132 RepID=UPI003C77A91A
KESIHPFFFSFFLLFFYYVGLISLISLIRLIIFSKALESYKIKKGITKVIPFDALQDGLEPTTP